MVGNGKRIAKLIFIIAFFVLCLIPVGFMWADSSSLAENRDLSPLPQWKQEDGTWNQNYFNEMQTYLAEHFAFRSMLVEADNLLKYKLFQSPGDEQVVIGKEGWLFFDATLSDYAGVTLSETELDKIAENLKEVCTYIEEQGKEPLLLLVPNKNSVYPEYMPARFGEKAKVTNLSLLQEKMDKQQIPYVDAYRILSDYKKTDEIYLRRDTHWNNTGARLVLNEVYQAWGLKDSYDLSSYNTDSSHEPDLYKLLFPQSVELETQRIYKAENTYNYIGRVRGMDDLVIQTVSEEGNGESVLVYRDSFGRAMIPYMGETFDMCIFNRSTPYDLSYVEETDCNYVLIEIVERNIADLGQIALP